MKKQTVLVLAGFLLITPLSNNAHAGFIDQLLEAQLLALDLSGQLRPPVDLTEQIYNDLAAIRAAHPEVADITYSPRAAPYQIIVGLTEQAAEQFRNGQYHALDELNQLYGVIEIDSHLLSFISALILKFDQVYNTQLLSNIYEEAEPEGLRYAEPNHRIGDGSTISADPPFYTFIRAWGDCPSGCIYHEYWHFSVENGQVTMLTMTYYVDALNGDDDNDGLSPETAFVTIQKGIDSANDGDTILVADGVYTGDGNRDIDFLGKAIIVKSENGPKRCLIWCNGTEAEPHRGFYFHSGEDATSIIEGIYIISGYAARGGGIYCYYSSPTITNCTISQNRTSGWSDGSGIYCKYSNPTITNCTISHNLTNGRGGGICCEWYSNPTITNCTINNNSANHDGGGGISCFRSAPTIVNCTISNNTARYGAGIFDGHPTVINCTISNNKADYNAGGGMQSCGGPVTDCIITGNTGVYPGGGGLNRCNGPITNCIITNNRISNGDGGGLYRCNGLITNCIISGNSTSDDGGGIDFTSCNNTITNCTVTGNRAGGFGGGIYGWWGGNSTISNCILWDNTARSGHEITLDYDYYGRPCTLTVLYSDIQGGQADTRIDPTCTLIWGSGNIDTDPCFVDPGYWDATGLWLDGDYHLLPESPCINTGDPNFVAEPNETDLDGLPRVIGGRIDMGAYEFFLRIEVAMRFTPQAMNPASQGKWLKAHIVLPEGYSLWDVDTNEPVVAQVVGLEVEADHVEVFVNEDGFVEIEAAFERTAFCGIAAADDIVEVTVEGQFTDGHHFYGTDTIRIVPRNFSSYLAALSSHWLRTGCSPPDWCSGLDFDQDGVINFADFALFDSCCIEVLEE